LSLSSCTCSAPFPKLYLSEITTSADLCLMFLYIKIK
jgi:hypothetical protein